MGFVLDLDLLIDCEFWTFYLDSGLNSVYGFVFSGFFDWLIDLLWFFGFWFLVQTTKDFRFCVLCFV